MSARFETKGSNNWQYRQGYQYVQRVPGPIMPMQPERKRKLWK